MIKLISYLEFLPRKIGEASKWISSILVLLIMLDVLFRYLFSNTKTWIIELEWHLFALIFLLGAAYAFQENQHVRVDVIYSKLSDNAKAIINIIGTSLFLIPWCLVIIYSSYNYALNSLAFMEGSPNPGGLPARYIIKFAITFGFSLLLLQAVAEIFKNLLVLLKK